MKPADINSNSEGTTQLDDISDLKLSWIHSREHLNAAEADNIRLAYDKYLGKKRYSFPAWFTVKHINQVHKIMFGKVWGWAGKYRRTEKSVGVKAFKISLEMSILEDEIHFWGKEKIFNPIEISARVHHRLVWIHPYENGNGRHGRFLGDMVLCSFGLEHTQWPKFTNNGNERRNYINALKDADRGDYSSLVQFLIHYR